MKYRLQIYTRGEWRTLVGSTYRILPNAIATAVDVALRCNAPVRLIDAADVTVWPEA